MEFISENWQAIVGIVLFAVVVVVLIILYRKNKINEQYLNNLIDYLDSIDDGSGIVPLLASYAKKAVLAVEQMVKAGVLPKTNEARKDKAMQIVNELAAADAIELSEKDKSAADSLIEAEVFELRR